MTEKQKDIKQEEFTDILCVDYDGSIKTVSVKKSSLKGDPLDSLREAKQLIKSEKTDVSEKQYQEETDVSENQYQKETDVSGNDFVEQNIGLFINEVVSFNTNQTDKTNDSFEESVISMEIEKFRMKNEKKHH